MIYIFKQIYTTEKHDLKCACPQAGTQQYPWKGVRKLRPTVSSAKNHLVYFSSTGYMDHPVWRGHCEEAKRELLGAHRITRNEGAMVPFLLPCATPGLASIAAWCGSG